ncbi:MAG: fumarate hydratase [Elusimicrobia bacterium]|nr:fumarate hydratase [Elusimicrobiota bacterium]
MEPETEIAQIFASEAEKAVIRLPKNLLQALNQAEENSQGLEKKVFSRIIENSFQAEKGKIPVCQDTGVFEVWLSVGKNSPLASLNLSYAATQGIRAAHSSGLLRASMDDVRPIIHIEYNDTDYVEVVVAARGFGSENYTSLHMLPPGSGQTRIIKEIVAAAEEAAARPCTPYLIGIGLGGTASKAVELSSKALTEIDFKPNDFEKKILDEVNGLGLGAGGFKGKYTALGVKVLKFPAHIAGLPLAVHLGCWANRYRKFRL